MKQFETIQSDKSGPLQRITLDRPEVLNAIDGRMLGELRAALDDAARDAAVRVIVVASACERAFCAGIDVAYVKDLEGMAAREVGRELHRTFLALRTIEKPVIAAIDGLCLGAGLELAVSCDLMIATTRSSFGLPNVKRGIPAIVEAAILPLAIGIQGARELAFTGAPWSADQALARGLLNAVVKPELLDAEVARWCATLVAHSPVGLATQKEIIHKWMTTDLESAIDFSINTVTLAFGSPGQREGMRSFLEKGARRG